MTGILCVIVATDLPLVIILLYYTNHSNTASRITDLTMNPEKSNVCEELVTSRLLASRQLGGMVIPMVVDDK